MMLAAVGDAKNREKCCPDCAAGVCKMCKIHVIIHVHTFPPLAFTRTSTPYTHTRIQSVTEHRLRGKTRVREQRREAVEGEMAWRARRDASLSSGSTPVFDASGTFVHTCRHLPTQNVARQSRATLKAHLSHSGGALAAEHAGCGNNHGLRKGGGAAL